MTETYSQILEAVKTNLSLSEVPEQHLTREVCLAALCRDPEEAQFSPWSYHELKGSQILEAVKKGLCLSEVPEQHLTKEVLLAFLLRNQEESKKKFSPWSYQQMMQGVSR